MEKLPALVKSRAMGGGRFVPQPRRSLLGAFARAPDNTFGVLSDLLGVIEGRLDIMRTGVQRRQALAAATPSIWPVPGWLSSPYGNRRDPFTGGPDFHPGLDISADYGEPVHATADGTIAVAGVSGNYGNLVEIDHGYGIVTRYGHLSPDSRPCRSAGPSRRRRRLRRIDRALDQPPPALRNPVERETHESSQAPRPTVTRFRLALGPA